MPAPTPKSAKAPSPILLPAGRLSAWLREAELLSENPFLEGGERLFIGAREKALGEWYTKMVEARKRDLLAGVTSLQRAIGQAQRPTEFKARVLSRVEGIERELREWVAWLTLRELEANGWLPFPLCSLRTERAVTSLVHRHYETGLPQRLTGRGSSGEDRADDKRLSRALRTSGVRGRFAWRRFRSQWERLPWPIPWIDAGPVPSAPASSNREGSGDSPEGLLSAGALREAEWYVRYVEKTGRRGSGGVKTENSNSGGSKFKGTSDVCPEALETGSPEEVDSKEGGPEEDDTEGDRPEVDAIEASDDSESGDEKTSSEESGSNQNGPGLSADLPSLPSSFIPSGEALLVSRAEWDAIIKCAGGSSGKKTRRVLEIRSGHCSSSIPDESAPGTGVRRFVAERRKPSSSQFPMIRTPMIRAWEVIPDSQIDRLQRSEKAMEKWRDARVKWVEVGKNVYSDGQGVGSEWDGYLILWPVDIFWCPEALHAAGYEGAARSAYYLTAESDGEESSNVSVTGEDSSREVDETSSPDGSSEGLPEEETIPFVGPKARRVQEPELEKSRVTGGERSERPEIHPEDLDLHPTFSPEGGGSC